MLSIAIETVRIVEELMKIWPNEVCDKDCIEFFLSTWTWSKFKSS